MLILLERRSCQAKIVRYSFWGVLQKYEWTFRYLVVHCGFWPLGFVQTHNSGLSQCAPVSRITTGTLHFADAPICIESPFTPSRTTASRRENQIPNFRSLTAGQQNTNFLPWKLFTRTTLCWDVLDCLNEFEVFLFSEHAAANSRMIADYHTADKIRSEFEIEFINETLLE